MKRNIFAGALFAAIGALFSLSAAAAITYSNTNDGQAAIAVAAPGGGAVRANDLVLSLAGAELTKSATGTPTVTVRLPAGINFDGTPDFVVTPAATGSGLTLKDSAGDPTVDNASVTLSDTDGDGGMDRAQVSVAADSAAGDTLTISVNITVGASVTAGTKTANVIVGTTVNAVNLVSVNASFVEPIYASAVATSVAQNSTATVTPTQTFIITVPKGTQGGKTMTLTVDDKLYLSPSWTSTLTVTQLTPSSGQVLKNAAAGVFTQTAATSATTKFTLTITGTSTYTVADDTQFSVSIDHLAQVADTDILGDQGLTLAGILTGQLALVDVKLSGSAATITGAVKAPNIVAGSSAKQTLPSIKITENFAGDAVAKGGTATITLTPSTGLTLAATTPTISAGFNVTPTVSTAGVLTLTIGADAGATKTFTITGIQATATSTAAGTLTVTVGGSRASGPDDDVLSVATAVPVGTPSLSLSAATKASKTGAGSSGTHNLLIKESTYGAITRAAASTDPLAPVNAVLTFEGSSNVTVNSITLSTSGYAAGTSPTISSCTAPATGKTVWTCLVTAESTAVSAGTSTVTAAINWTAKTTAAVGSEIVITAGGNVGVSGAITVATVSVTTAAEVSGAIPDLTPGSLTQANIATVKITELYTGAVTTTVGSSFRLLAPTGIAFQNASAIQASSASVGTATISSTFNPNDTLTLTRVGTQTITFTAKVVVASGVSGLQSFSLVDGDINGANLSNIQPATLDLAYVDGTLDALDAGDAAAVNVGFTTSNTVEGGLAPYTVASSSEAAATVAVDGSTVTATGVAAGATTITVTDALGATDTYVVTVSAGAAEPAQGKATKASDGSTSAATFTGGATIDGGTTYTDAITTADDVIINATINVDPADVGVAGGLHAVVLSPTGLLMLEADGSWVPWDGKIANVATYLEVDALAATHTIPLYNGAIATAGKWRFAVVYSTDTGKLVYTTKAAVITVTE